MSGTVVGTLSKSLSRDEEGHRDYKVTRLVRVTSLNDGPQVVLNSSGLSTVGDIWLEGTDVDPWAFCTPQTTVNLHRHDEGEPWEHWAVTQNFTTRPLHRCMDETIEDPLLEPDRISGSFVKYTEESHKDRFGNVIKSSSHEIFTGPLVEWDANRPAVVIEQNRANLELSLLANLIDKVNDATLWGLTSRKIKLSNVSWERKWFGICGIYYTRRLEFDINDKTFDREIPDQGTKVIAGKWDKTSTPWTWSKESWADKDNPSHFIRWQDGKGNVGKVLLDGSGAPLTLEGTGTGTTAEGTVDIPFEKYEEGNLLTLGIPTILAPL